MCECYMMSRIFGRQVRTCQETCSCFCHVPPPPPKIDMPKLDTTPVAKVIDLTAFKWARKMGSDVLESIEFATYKEQQPYVLQEPLKKTTG